MKPIKTNRSLIVYILLSAVTCGIYGLVFMYQLIRDVNTLCEEDGKRTTGLLGLILLSTITCGIYGIVWWYKLAERLHDTGFRWNVDAGVDGGKYLLWSIPGSLLCGIGPLYASHLIFRATNRLAAEYNAGNIGTV